MLSQISPSRARFMFSGSPILNGFYAPPSSGGTETELGVALYDFYKPLR